MGELVQGIQDHIAHMSRVLIAVLTRAPTCGSCRVLGLFQGKKFPREEVKVARPSPPPFSLLPPSCHPSDAEMLVDAGWEETWKMGTPGTFCQEHSQERENGLHALHLLLQHHEPCVSRGTTVSRRPPCVFSSPEAAAPRCTGHDDRRLDFPRVSAKPLPEQWTLTSGDPVSPCPEVQGRSRALQPVVLIKNLRSRKASVQRSRCRTTSF